MVILSFAGFKTQGGLDSGVVAQDDLFDIQMPAFAKASGIKLLQAKGKRVLVSLGGGDKQISTTKYKLAPRIFTELFYLDKSNSATKFAQAVKQLVEKNGLDGIDLVSCQYASLLK